MSVSNPPAVMLLAAPLPPLPPTMRVRSLFAEIAPPLVSAEVVIVALFNEVSLPPVLVSEPDVRVRSALEPMVPALLSRAPVRFSVRSVVPGLVPSACIVPLLARLAALIARAPVAWMVPPVPLVMARLPAPKAEPWMASVPVALIRPLVAPAPPLVSALAMVSMPLPPATIWPPAFDRLAAVRA